jgi:ArsR family transcriptional regulator, arsenate/arsenite/antimonite-responsive transcriptional repressor
MRYRPLGATAADRPGRCRTGGQAQGAIGPVRLRLLSVVASHAGGEACVCDLSVGIELTQPTISHHLKILRTAGLLDSERRGSWVYYRVVTDALHQLSVLLGADALVTSGP